MNCTPDIACRGRTCRRRSWSLLRKGQRCAGALVRVNHALQRLICWRRWKTKFRLQVGDASRGASRASSSTAKERGRRTEDQEPRRLASRAARSLTLTRLPPASVTSISGKLRHFFLVSSSYPVQLPESEDEARQGCRPDDAMHAGNLQVSLTTPDNASLHLASPTLPKV